MRDEVNNDVYCDNRLWLQRFPIIHSEDVSCQLIEAISLTKGLKKKTL